MAPIGGRLKKAGPALVVLGLVAIAACSSSPRTARPETQISFGASVARRGLWREALFRFQQAIQREPKNARAHNNLAVALEATGDFAAALAEYKKALELDPGDNYIRRNYARFAEFYTSFTRTTGKAASGL